MRRAQLLLIPLAVGGFGAAWTIGGDPVAAPSVTVPAPPVTTNAGFCDPPCPLAHVVRTAAQLRDALRSAVQGEVIEVPDGVAVDLDEIVGDLPLEIRAGVTLQSLRRARRFGALLHLDHNPSTGNLTVFRLAGTRAVIRNLRLRGPSSTTSGDGPSVTAIRADTEYSALILDNEIYDWPGIAVDVRGNDTSTACRPSTGSRGFHVRVVRNYIHHNQRDRLGYGVGVHDGGVVDIEGNAFDWNRHAISGDGSPTSRYYARYNYVLSGGSRYGAYATYNGAYQQHFDMHGTGGGGYGGVAGDFVEILGNTVHGEQEYGTVLGFGGKTRPVYWLRGKPCHRNELRGNVVVHERDEVLRTSDGGADQVDGLSENTYDKDTAHDLAVGDFDGDGRDDLFQATGAAWYYSSGGVTEWRLLAAGRTEPMSRLRFGDFDGDGNTDVLSETLPYPGSWRVSRGGTGPWISLGPSVWPLKLLRFGDFDGDGTTDVFFADGSHWRYVPSLIQRPCCRLLHLADSAYKVEELGFGDFNGDGRTDVFGVEGGQWSVSYGGASGWQRLNSLLTDDVASLVFADFDGNGRTDIAQSRVTGLVVEWRVSWDGTSSWHTLRTVPYFLDNRAHLFNHWIGRFDSSPGADAVRYEVHAGSEGTSFVRSSGARAGYVTHSRNGMR